MNDLPDLTKYSRVALFVDDTKCFGHIPNIMASQSLQEDLACIADWRYRISF